MSEEKARRSAYVVATTIARRRPAGRQSGGCDGREADSRRAPTARPARRLRETLDPYPRFELVGRCAGLLTACRYTRYDLTTIYVSTVPYRTVPYRTGYPASYPSLSKEAPSVISKPKLLRLRAMMENAHVPALIVYFTAIYGVITRSLLSAHLTRAPCEQLSDVSYAKFQNS